MWERPGNLPDFTNPPIAEAVFGLQYETDRPLLAHHIGLYWQLVENEFPNVQQHPPLAQQMEDLRESPSIAGLPVAGVEFMTGPPPLPRCWFLDASGGKLLQFQPGGFLHNWRRVPGSEEYPRFESLRDEFVARWREFARFAEEQGVGQPRVTQAELTYVNLMEPGVCWQEVADIPRVFSSFARREDQADLPPLEAIECHLHYRLPENRGRLHVDMGPVIRRTDMETVLRMKLTARGPTTGSTEEAIMAWMQFARESVVRSFTALTTAEAHQHWGRIV